MKVQCFDWTCPWKRSNDKDFRTLHAEATGQLDSKEESC